jgi:hypothetical protein
MFCLGEMYSSIRPEVEQTCSVKGDDDDVVQPPETLPRNQRKGHITGLRSLPIIINTAHQIARIKESLNQNYFENHIIKYDTCSGLFKMVSHFCS